MTNITIPVKFFKAIGEKPTLVRILWIKWFADYSEQIGKEGFVEDFIKSHADKKLNLEQVQEAYDFGMKFFEGGLILKKQRKERQPYSQELVANIKEVINYLNSMAGTGYTATKANSECIAARIKEGYSIEDLKSVVDKKVLEWKGTDKEQYIRPITLFQAKKFENYLHQPQTIKNGKSNSVISKLSNASDLAKKLLS